MHYAGLDISKDEAEKMIHVLQMYVETTGEEDKHENVYAQQPEMLDNPKRGGGARGGGARGGGGRARGGGWRLANTI